LSYNSFLRPPWPSQGIEELFPARPVDQVTDHASALDAVSVRQVERLIEE
jgi:hypothetical protein